MFGDGNVAVTGHSLGGGLASAAALAIGASAVTFNASGLGNNTLESLGFNPNAIREQAAESGQIRRYAVNGDQLTAAQEDVPLLPIVGSPPEAVGHALRIDPPPGTGFGSLHGGGGPNAVYVEAFNHATPTDPSLGPSGGQVLGGHVDAGIDAAGSLDGARSRQDRFQKCGFTALERAHQRDAPWTSGTSDVLSHCRLLVLELGPRLGRRPFMLCLRLAFGKRENVAAVRRRERSR